MPEPVLSSLEAEEALVAALLLQDDPTILQHFDDEDMWYDHLRTITRAVRALHASRKPFGMVFACWFLEKTGELDGIEWRGDRAEVLVNEIIGRHIYDVQLFYPVALAKLIHHYAERRTALVEAQGAAKRTFQETLERVGVVMPSDASGFVE